MINLNPNLLPIFTVSNQGVGNTRAPKQGSKMILFNLDLTVDPQTNLDLSGLNHWDVSFGDLKSMYCVYPAEALANFDVITSTGYITKVYAGSVGYYPLMTYRPHSLRFTADPSALLALPVQIGLLNFEMPLNFYPIGR